MILFAVAIFYYIHSTYHSPNTFEYILAYSLVVCLPHWNIKLPLPLVLLTAPSHPLAQRLTRRASGVFVKRQKGTETLPCHREKRCLLVKVSAKASVGRWPLTEPCKQMQDSRGRKDGGEGMAEGGFHCQDSGQKQWRVFGKDPVAGLDWYLV